MGSKGKSSGGYYETGLIAEAKSFAVVVDTNSANMQYLTNLVGIRINVPLPSSHPDECPCLLRLWAFFIATDPLSEISTISLRIFL
ncbi:hypothetical protein Nepgr_021753 [Nepenthes gracilis]|uniref:Uncharacterized protein n=1 Tax=Nepenthes gracilis TaxID=150966 RepID=A0AAD3SZG0_NEPGR|nr:hypothetical protein Nepgr_021753 [Nepenthes gracilis]